MKIKVITLLIVASAVQPAFADQTKPWYMGVSIGHNNVSDIDVTRTTIVKTTGTKFKSNLDAGIDNDTAYALTLGYRLNDAVSFEAEYAYRSNDEDKIKNSNSNAINNTLKLNTDSLMGNVIYSFTSLGVVRPYVGIGLGAAKVEARYKDSIGTDKDSDWALAYQGILGAEVDLSENWELFGQYQYFMVSSPGVKPTTVNAANTTSNSYKLDEYQADTFSLGLRYSF